MRLVVSMHHVPPPDWDASLAVAGSEAGLLQSSFWGSLMAALGRGHPLYLTVRDGEKVVAMLLAIHSNRSVAGKGRALRVLTTLVGMGRIEFSDGPVILDGSMACAAVDALLEWLSRYARRQGVRIIRSSGLSPSSPLAGDGQLAAAYTARGYETTPWATYLVDLRLDEEALFMSLDHAARKGIKKAGREGVHVRALTDWDDYRNSFLLPYLGWTRGAEAHDEDLATAGRIWEHPGHHELYCYYVAEANDGTVLAALGMYLFNGVATEITSGVAPAAIERKLPAQYLLHWEMFLEARRAGCHTFNLAGVAPQPASPKEENIRRFKKKWGGRHVQFDRFEWRHWLLRSATHLIGFVRGRHGWADANPAKAG